MFLEVRLVPLDLHHQLVNVDQLGCGSNLREGGHPQHPAEPVVVLDQGSQGLLQEGGTQL